jgi:NADPH-dependent F420 reductase
VDDVSDQYSTKPVIAIIGGAGALGSGLARRWVKAGYEVIVGSRTPEKIGAAIEALAAVAAGPKPRGLSNREAAEAGEVVLVAVPFAAAAVTLDEIAGALRGKVVIDATVPLVPPRVARVQLPPEGSAAVAAQARLGDEVRVVSAFHNVAAAKLQTDEDVDCDILVFGDKRDDRAVVVGLAEAAHLRGVHAGPLANSAAAEALTSVLIGINRFYGAEGAGIRITGIGRLGGRASN